MNKIKYIIIILLAATCLAACKSQQNTNRQNITTTDGTDATSPMRTLIIMYDPATGVDPLLKATENYEARIIYRYNIINGIAIEVPTEKNIADAVKYFKSVEGVVSVTRDREVNLMQ